MYIHYSICKFNLNKSCTKRPPPPTTISHLKIHEHNLILIPIWLLLPCDACGLSLSDPKDLIYACFPCSCMVHRSCIYLPRVIQIIRHPHHFSLTSCLQPSDYLCVVCRKTIDVNYGQYSCNKGCHYDVHSKCGTREDVWDGKDLGGVPEDPEENLEPFVRINGETIQHFSHEHCLRLNEKKLFARKTSFLRHAPFQLQSLGDFMVVCSVILFSTRHVPVPLYLQKNTTHYIDTHLPSTPPMLVTSILVSKRYSNVMVSTEMVVVLCTYAVKKIVGLC